MDFNVYNGYYSFPAGTVLPINQDDDESYFLSLPEQTQQQLLKQNFTSQQEFHDQLQRLKEKEAL
ncbi:MAG: CUE domain-containing protein [Oscillospiraceae bacterium]